MASRGLLKLKTRLFDVFLGALRAADYAYVVYVTACVYRERETTILDNFAKRAESEWLKNRHKTQGCDKFEISKLHLELVIYIIL